MSNSNSSETPGPNESMSLAEHQLGKLHKDVDTPLDEYLRKLTPPGGFPLPDNDKEFPELAKTIYAQEGSDLYLYQLARQLYKIEGQFINGEVDPETYIKLHDHINQRRRNHIEEQSKT